MLFLKIKNLCFLLLFWMNLSAHYYYYYTSNIREKKRSRIVFHFIWSLYINRALLLPSQHCQPFLRILSSHKNKNKNKRREGQDIFGGHRNVQLTHPSVRPSGKGRKSSRLSSGPAIYIGSAFIVSFSFYWEEEEEDILLLDYLRAVDGAQAPLQKKSGWIMQSLSSQSVAVLLWYHTSTSLAPIANTFSQLHLQEMVSCCSFCSYFRNQKWHTEIW